MRSLSSTNNSNTISLPRHRFGGVGGGSHHGTGGNHHLEEVAGAQDTIYLCNFRVSVDGEWLCLKELQDLDIQEVGSGGGGGGGSGGNNDHGTDGGTITNYGDRCDEKNDRDSWVHYSRDPAAIERSNLVNICKLVVKELLEQSLRFGRMLDSDHLPLQHFFIVLEHVLRHGLKPKKGLLGPKKELWDLLQSVEKYSYQAQDITASVRDLPTVRTHMGRARAWLRIALMQKKLADYLQALMEHKDESLAEYYEPHALMMSEEVIVILGILVGLNVIDCNLCVKEEDLDSQQGVIDFSLYLRSSKLSSPDDDLNNQNQSHQSGNTHSAAAIEAAGAAGNMNTVLDQKNYIEELNRHLNATVGNLQSKVETLTTNNALMKEDLAIARNSLMALQAENAALRQKSSDGSGGGNNSGGNNVDNSHIHDRIDPEMVAALSDEKKKRQDIEKELDLQMSLKAETEMAMKLLEKDIHEKQDTIISLRRQLEDIKAINLEMYRKLQECEASLKHKTDLLSKLESQKETMASAITQLEKKHLSEMASLAALQETSQALSGQVVASEERVARAEAELRIEREWRNDLQEKEMKSKEQINSLQFNIKKLNEDGRKYERTKQDYDKIKKQWSEAQITLEELGMQLSVSKLQVSELQEKASITTQNSDWNNDPGGTNTGGGVGNNGAGGVWTPDSMQSTCKGCSREFSMTRRKHHCRNCGEIFCKQCSEQLAPLPNDQGQFGKPVRVCDGCWEIINAPRN